jgi:hypothetical protein
MPPCTKLLVAHGLHSHVNRMIYRRKQNNPETTPKQPGKEGKERGKRGEIKRGKKEGKHLRHLPLPRSYVRSSDLRCFRLAAAHSMFHQDNRPEKSRIPPFVPLNHLMTWNPAELGGPTCLTEKGAREPLAGACIIVPYPLERCLGV